MLVKEKPSSYILIEGDLLDSTVQYIAHQCNCISEIAGGIAKQIFTRFPYSDIYTGRHCLDNSSSFLADCPGTIIIKGDGIEDRYIINMMSQYNPGGISTCDWDSPNKREEYFYQCLEEIKKISNLKSIAFPYLIGCGIAGGNWEVYEKMIEDFAFSIIGTTQTYIYKLPSLIE